MTNLSKPIWAIDTTRNVKGKPVTRRFTSLAWKLMAGDDNLKAGRWKKIPGPVSVQPIGLASKRIENKIDATRGAIDLAKESGIAIQDVQGSGSGGRITKADVEEHLVQIGLDEEE